MAEWHLPAYGNPTSLPHLTLATSKAWPNSPPKNSQHLCPQPSTDAMSYLQHHLSTVERGALGTFASLGSAAVSMVSHLEVYLRVAGLCVGLAVGVVTLLSVYHDLRRKQKEQQHNYETTGKQRRSASITIADRPG
jgi:hypothetical protein